MDTHHSLPTVPECSPHSALCALVFEEALEPANLERCQWGQLEAQFRGRMGTALSQIDSPLGRPGLPVPMQVERQWPALCKIGLKLLPFSWGAREVLGSPQQADWTFVKGLRIGLLGTWGSPGPNLTLFWGV